MKESTRYRKQKGYWSPNLQCIMEAAAATVLYRLRDYRGFITKDDLVSEAWLGSGRYGCPKTEKKQYIWSMLHICAAKKRLEKRNKPFSILPAPIFTSLDLVDLDSDCFVEQAQEEDVLEAEDCWYLLVSCCATDRDCSILHHRLMGGTMQQIGDTYGICKERVRQVLCKIKERYDDATKERIEED